jgi:voltage-gated potassium channel
VPASRARAREVTVAGWRAKLHEIIFEADTPAGKAFDVWLLIAIVLSVAAAILETVAAVRVRFGTAIRVLEWSITILFSIEYVLRLVSVGRPLRYATSFFGLVDLVAIVPTYLSLFFAGSQTLIVVRALRLLRVFRVLKLVRFVSEARLLTEALRASGRKIIVFLGAVLTLVLIIGAAMYLIEGEEHGFTNIPESVYWAIVTMTTVGYGDIAPATVLGKLLASVVMIIGYGIIAVPTGIVTAEMAGRWRQPVSTQACPQCSAEGHDVDAKHCKQCGARL